MIYYKRCKKTRVWIPEKVPKPCETDGLSRKESTRKKKTKWRKET